MYRYQAPIHTTEIFSPNGVLTVGVDGLVSLAEDAALIDHQTLLHAGCILLPSEEAEKRALQDSKSKKASPVAESSDAVSSGQKNVSSDHVTSTE